MAIRYFVQKIDVGEDPSDEFQPEGNVVDSTEITEEHYEMIEKNKNAVERGFDGRWHEAFMTLIQAIETIKDDYRQDAKETRDPDVEQELLGRKLIVERILLEAERLKESAEGT